MKVIALYNIKGGAEKFINAKHHLEKYIKGTDYPLLDVLAVSRRTAQVNQIRGLLLEYGIDIPKGRSHVRGH